MVGSGKDVAVNHLYVGEFEASGASGSVNPVAETVTVVPSMLLSEIEGLINLTIITTFII